MIFDESAPSINQSYCKFSDKLVKLLIVIPLKKIDVNKIFVNFISAWSFNMAIMTLKKSHDDWKKIYLGNRILQTLRNSIEMQSN